MVSISPSGAALPGAAARSVSRRGAAKLRPCFLPVRLLGAEIEGDHHGKMVRNSRPVILPVTAR